MKDYRIRKKVTNEGKIRYGIEIYYKSTWISYWSLHIPPEMKTERKAKKLIDRLRAKDHKEWLKEARSKEIIEYPPKGEDVREDPCFEENMRLIEKEIKEQLAFWLKERADDIIYNRLK